MNPKIEIKICIKIGNLKNQESKLIRDFDQEFSYKKFMLSSETITVYDLAGNSTNISVKITNIDKSVPTSNLPTNQNINTTTVSPNILPKTGAIKILFFVILLYNSDEKFN